MSLCKSRPDDDISIAIMMCVVEEITSLKVYVLQ